MKKTFAPFSHEEEGGVKQKTKLQLNQERS
jgi:hypothetical protein